MNRPKRRRTLPPRYIYDSGFAPFCLREAADKHEEDIKSNVHMEVESSYPEQLSTNAPAVQLAVHVIEPVLSTPRTTIPIESNTLSSSSNSSTPVANVSKQVLPHFKCPLCHVRARCGTTINTHFKKMHANDSLESLGLGVGKPSKEELKWSALHFTHTLMSVLSDNSQRGSFTNITLGFRRKLAFSLLGFLKGWMISVKSDRFMVRLSDDGLSRLTRRLVSVNGALKDTLSMSPPFSLRLANSSHMYINSLRISIGKKIPRNGAIPADVMTVRLSMKSAASPLAKPCSLHVSPADMAEYHHMQAIVTSAATASSADFIAQLQKISVTQ